MANTLKNSYLNEKFKFYQSLFISNKFDAMEQTPNPQIYTERTPRLKIQPRRKTTWGIRSSSGNPDKQGMGPWTFNLLSKHSKRIKLWPSRMLLNSLLTPLKYESINQLKNDWIQKKPHSEVSHCWRILKRSKKEFRSKQFSLWRMCKK